MIWHLLNIIIAITKKYLLLIIMYWDRCQTSNSTWTSTCIPICVSICLLIWFSLRRLRQKGNEDEALKRIHEAFNALYEGTCVNDDQKDFTGQRYIYANDFRLLLTITGEFYFWSHYLILIFIFYWYFYFYLTFT